MSGRVGTDAAKRLLEQTGAHPVVSLYFDLDPEEFATAPARATQARALLDQARRLGEADVSLSHEDRGTLEQDLTRVDDYLGSDDLPVSDVRAVALFCSGGDDLFETVPLHAPTSSAVYVARGPHVEPLVTQAGDQRWCAVLASSRTGHVLLGTGRRVTDHQSIEDYVRGRGDRGGAAINTEGQDIEGHLISLADAIYRDWQRRPFDLLALGGPVQAVSRLRELLHNDLRPALADAPLGVDESAARDADIRDAITALLEQAHDARASAALRQLDDTTRAVRGLAETLEALTERRVQTLLLSRDFAAAGGRCPQDGLLVQDGVTSCPADGTAVEPVPDLREAVVQAALRQDAEVIALSQPADELPAAHPVAALLRF